MSSDLILSLYDLLEVLAPNPFTTLNRAVAVGMVHGPQAGLQVLAELAADKRMVRHHRLLATRAHLRELADDEPAAAADYREAARRATSVPERRYLALQAARLQAARPRACRPPPGPAALGLASRCRCRCRCRGPSCDGPYLGCWKHWY